MKMISILVLFLMSFSNSTNYYIFLDDCVTVFINMDRATNEFSEIAGKNSNVEILNNAIKKYNETILLHSYNKIVKHTKSENPEVRRMSTDIGKILTDLVKNNYNYLSFLTNKKNRKSEILKRGIALVEKNKSTINLIEKITLGIMVESTDESIKVNRKNTIPLKITKIERQKIESEIFKNYNQTIKKGLKKVFKNDKITSFKRASLMLYDYFKFDKDFIYKNE